MKVKVYFGLAALLWFACLPLLGQQSSEAPKVPAVVAIQQANEKIRLLANSSAVGQPSQYTLSPGDLIEVDVFDIPELSRKARIDPSGYIAMPLIPKRIRAAGLTPSQLQTEIADLLKARGLVSHPQVSVFLEQRVGQPITIIGAVEHPRVYHAMGRTTLLEALSAAGGLTDTAADYVTITHTSENGKAAVKRIGLRDLIERGDPKANVVVTGGDVITVPRAGIVYVVGAVNRPGGFVIQSDTGQMTTLEALALAGGTMPAAKTANAVVIRKNRATGRSQEITVNLKKILSRKAQDMQLEANDILFIPTSAGKKMLAKAAEAALSMTTGIMILRGAQF